MQTRSRARAHTHTHTTHILSHPQPRAVSQLGLVVDLTFTDKYYNGSAEFAANGVDYLKVQAPAGPSVQASPAVSRRHPAATVNRSIFRL